MNSYNRAYDTFSDVRHLFYTGVLFLACSFFLHRDEIKLVICIFKLF